MATTFLEPGGDSTFAVATTNGFWPNGASSGGIKTDFVHGAHVKSIGSGVSPCASPNGACADAGTRMSIYIYFAAIPSGAVASLFGAKTTGAVSNCYFLRMTSAGVLQLWNGTSAQIGIDGPTLKTGFWYRISMAYTVSSTSVNRFEVFVNGVSAISVTNATLTTISSSVFSIGNTTSDAALSFRSSDHYIDNSNTLKDTGDIWVTAKRPNANGTNNDFSTQIGSGGSGYGTGHSPQVNERALSTTNGWSMIGAGSAVTEEYKIENMSTGDFDVSNATIVDYVAWVSASSLSSETASIVVAGATSNISLTSTITTFTKIKGSTTYPGGATAIGIITTTALTTVSLYECGIIVAFIPNIANRALQVNQTMNRAHTY